MRKIDHPALIQEWDINLYTEAYLKKPDKKKDLCQRKNKFIGTIANNFDQKLLLKTCNSFLFRVLCYMQQIILSVQQII